MNVLICGASGFIGRHMDRALRAHGHQVVRGGSGQRTPVDNARISMDFARDIKPAQWLRRLDGIDAVINAVGVLRDSVRNPIRAMHEMAPRALYEACAAVGVRRVIHVSALGVAGGTTAYACSKRAGEVALETLAGSAGLQAAILRPSLVFGHGGASADFLLRLAQWPLLPLPAAAFLTRLQPVAVSDLAAATAALLGSSAAWCGTLHCVGPTPLTVAELIATLRHQSGHASAKTFALPEGLSRFSARLGDHWPRSPWCSESRAMLLQDNIAPSDDLAQLLGRAPCPPQQFLQVIS